MRDWIRELEAMPEARGVDLEILQGKKHLRVFGTLGGIRRFLFQFSRGKSFDTSGRGGINLRLNARRELNRLQELCARRQPEVSTA